MTILILMLMWVQDGAAVVIGYGAVGYAMSIVGVLTLAGWMKRFSGLQGPVPTLRATANASAPFFLMVALCYLYGQGPIALLEWLLGGAEAAVYSAANMVIVAASLFPHIIYQKLLLAKLYRWGVHDLDKQKAAFHLGVLLMASTGLVLCLTTCIMAPWIIGTLFGPKYVEAVFVLRVLSLSLPLRFISQSFSSVFVSKQALLKKSAYFAWAAAVNFTLCLLIAPRVGAVGAAIASTCAEVVVLALHVRGVPRYVGGIDLRRIFSVQAVGQSARRVFGGST